MGSCRNPGLIFDEVLIERANRVSRLYLEKSLGPFALDRVTLFVTHKCNLACEYCNGPHLSKSMDPREKAEMLEADVSLEQYSKMLGYWAKNGLKHVHFTGGEATLHPCLPRFVEMAAEKGISCTLTTNGTADTGLYRELVDKGLSEIRISIDSTVNKDFDGLVRVKGACKRVKENIAALTEMRDNGRDLFVILNACVGSFNVDKIKATMQSLIDLNADDVKFLVVAEEGEEVGSKASRELVEKLLGFAEERAEGYELLKKKIRTLFRRGSFGLVDENARREMKQCFIPLTERTLDARGVYPCSIYLRYGGKPIISADASFDRQQEAINGFVEGNDCRLDPICEQNCTNCCKKFNIEVNRRVCAHESKEKAGEKEVIRIGNVSKGEVNEVLKIHDEIMGLDASLERPYAIIKPQGLMYADEIKDYLESQGISIVKESLIYNWQLYSLFLYSKRLAKEDCDFRIAKNKAHCIFEKGNTAMHLTLEKRVPEKKLLRARSELRYWYGEELGYFSYKGDRHLLRTNCLHAPNYKDLPRENRIARYFLGG